MADDHRQGYHRVWSLLTPPLQPHANVITAYREAFAGRSGRMLLLGVTPQLADIAPDLVAVDRNAPMIANIWPGDTERRKAVLGEWRRLGFPDASFANCVGDLSLVSQSFPNEAEVCIGEVARVLAPGGRFACRVLLPPERTESEAELRDMALSGQIRNFHAFKLRLGMALAAREPRPQINVEALLEAFNALFPDREELVRISGWDRAHVDTIEYYRGSKVVHAYPTREQLLSLISPLFARIEFVPTSGYELSERALVMIADTA
jgi:SAM-dependent methyltransferase